jgi:hypothetical protein
MHGQGEFFVDPGFPGAAIFSQAEGQKDYDYTDQPAVSLIDSSDAVYDIGERYGRASVPPDEI